MKNPQIYLENPQDYKSVKISLVSAEQIREWSYGEVKTSETINYRTSKPERDGLFCGRIFGPVVDYECICGKYKRMKHRGITCEKCGVEVIKSNVRRERLGHINLCVPIAHSWFFKGSPSYIGIVLDMGLKNLGTVIYFGNYIILNPGETGLTKGKIISEEEYSRYSQEDKDFVAGIGAEAISELLQEIDVEELSNDLKLSFKNSNSDTQKKKIIKRLEIIESFKNSGCDLNNMILNVIPVLSPDLRPLVPLDGGRLAASDLNDLYRRVIHRNNRLKRLMELNAPNIIVKNEKRMLQESVDSLFDNSRRVAPIIGNNGRPLKSLSDSLKGKYGRFRQNLLGKRVDYSGRTVIVVGPELKLNQCGIPKLMAIELFKPFIISYLIKHDLASTIKIAKKMIETSDPNIFIAIEKIATHYPVLLNRAPTLHRLGIQAFEIKLVEDKAIHLHPLVCTAFNADFDGDQMAVHVPLSIEAQMEAKILMMASNNILSAATGKPIMIPDKDMVLGIYWVTKDFPGRKGEGKIFSGPSQALIAYEYDFIDLQARIKVRIEEKIYDTTVGRMIIYDVLPKTINFSIINKVFKKKDIENLVDIYYRFSGSVETVKFLDIIKKIGFDYATKSGISISISDLIIPKEKDNIIKNAEKGVLKIQNQHQEGIITDSERYNKVVNLWSVATEDIANRMLDILAEEKKDENGEYYINPIFAMADSGARGSTNQNKQLCGMRGLMAKPSGAIIETPITVNFREGLNSQQYFISTHGARKGLADTALKTARSGYLTRKLVDVAQDSIVSMVDCGTKQSFKVEWLVENGEVIEKLGERILGRITAKDVTHPYTKEVLVEKGCMFDENNIVAIDKALVDFVEVRSVLTCEAEYGCCAKCYGRDLGRGKLVSVGEAVGIIAAQSIGEPGTQLTMRTFHIGGTASNKIEDTSWVCTKPGNIKLDKVKMVVNRDKVQVVFDKRSEAYILNEEGHIIDKLRLPLGSKILFRDKQEVKIGDTIAEWDPFSIPILSNCSGITKFVDIVENQSMMIQTDEVTRISRNVIIENYEYDLKPRLAILDENGEEVKIKGTKITHKGFDLPFLSELVVKDGSVIQEGDILAKIPRESAKTKDITGGLPRVVDLFEARVPKNPCQITEISGVVEIGEAVRRKRKLIVKPDVGKPKEYLIPRGSFITVMDGDYVESGDTLTDGHPNPHDILRVKGIASLQKYLVNEVLEVYRMQGVKINDKHAEVIINHMLEKVQIINVGDSRFIGSEKVSRRFFKQENMRLESAGLKKATAKPILLGVMQAALHTDSFISAASFQETTKVLTAASIRGSLDHFRGPKENVILGRLIPVGTGFNSGLKVYNYENEEKDIIKDQKEVFLTEEQV